VRAAPLVAVVFALAACGGNGGDNAATIPAGLVDPGTYKSEPFEPAMHTNPQVRWRVFVVDAEGTPLTIVYGAPTATFDQALTQVEPLLASIEFD
jgi:hypothetical protein